MSVKVRHRRRSVHAEAIAPWAALSFILLIWWAGAKAVDWMKPGHQYPLLSFGWSSDGDMAKAKPVDDVPAEPVVKAQDSSPTISADTTISHSDLATLRSRSLLIPVRGLEADDLVSSFQDARGSRRHEAIDILAPRGIDVLAVDDGKVAKLFTSEAGGLTVYQFDPSETFVYYYAHLDRYATDLREGEIVRKGDLIGSVGTTGNAPKDTPHLHFAIAKLDPDRRWWGGTALDPFLVWRGQEE
jgi:murein DD-endopeptidase MepM/ murein hydrolase activator NlpD